MIQRTPARIEARNEPAGHAPRTARLHIPEPDASWQRLLASAVTRPE